MIRNKIFNTTPSIVHAPGDPDFSIHWLPIKTKLFGKKAVSCKHLNDLTIFTWNSHTESFKKCGIFEKSLKHFGYKCDVLVSSEWESNRKKIELTCEHLQKIKTPYVMGVDSCDALVVRALDAIVADFLKFDCALLFNAERRFWPPRGLSKIKDFEDSLPTAPYYLNAGAWIGKRDFCIAFFNKALEVSRTLMMFPKSEQVCIKHIYQEFYPSVQIDKQSIIFQNLNLQREEDIELRL